MSLKLYMVLHGLNMFYMCREITNGIFLVNSQINRIFHKVKFFIMLSKIDSLKGEVSGIIVNTLEELESFRIKYLSKKGVLSSLMEDFRKVPTEQKREIGQILNELKIYIN